jgi:hypothetical protein
LTEKTLKDIDGLIIYLKDCESTRTSDIEETLKSCELINGRIQKSVKLLLESGE